MPVMFGRSGPRTAGHNAAQTDQEKRKRAGSLVPDRASFLLAEPSRDEPSSTLPPERAPGSLLLPVPAGSGQGARSTVLDGATRYHIPDYAGAKHKRVGDDEASRTWGTPLPSDGSVFARKAAMAASRFGKTPFAAAPSRTAIPRSPSAGLL